MSFKEILLALTTYPQPTPLLAVDGATEVAVALNANISAIACDVKLNVPRNLLTNYMLDIPGMVAAAQQEAARNADTLLQEFTDLAKRRKVFRECIRPSCPTSRVPDIFVEHAKLHDLTIVPVPGGDFVDQWYGESILFGSGRPTMILPWNWKHSVPFAFHNVVIAWDFSRPATRAVADAMPILRTAKNVFIATVVGEKELHTEEPAERLISYLQRHDIEASISHLDANGLDAAECLAQEAIDRKADLLVMGAYGHSRLRDFFLGGVTKAILSNPPLAIFLSH